MFNNLMKNQSFYIILVICLLVRQSETLILTKRGYRHDNKRRLSIEDMVTIMKYSLIVLGALYFVRMIRKQKFQLPFRRARELRVTPINTRRKRILFDKFDQQMRYLRNKRIRGLHSLRDIQTKRMRDKMYLALNQLMHRTINEGADQRSFNREYPTLSRFIIRKAKEGRKLTLKRMFIISNEYAKRYHHIDLMKNKAIVGLAMGKFLSEIPRIVKQMSN